jgi:hypothetical protein
MRPHFMAPTGWSSRKTCMKCSTLSDPPIVDFTQEKGCLIDQKYHGWSFRL